MRRREGGKERDSWREKEPGPRKEGYAKKSTSPLGRDRHSGVRLGKKEISDGK